MGRATCGALAGLLEEEGQLDGEDGCWGVWNFHQAGEGDLAFFGPSSSSGHPFN